MTEDLQAHLWHPIVQGALLWRLGAYSYALCGLALTTDVKSIQPARSVNGRCMMAMRGNRVRIDRSLSRVLHADDRHSRDGPSMILYRRRYLAQREQVRMDAMGGPGECL